MSEQQAHRYVIGDRVILTNGVRAVIRSLWWEDDGTPGYGVLMDTLRSTGVRDVHIVCREAGPAAEGGVRR